MTIRHIRNALLAGLILAAAPAFAEERADQVAARVGDTEILESDVAFATSFLGDPNPEATPEARKSAVVDALIDLKVVSDAALREGMENDETFKRQMAFLRQQALRQAYLTKAAAAAVTEDAVRKAYDERVAAMPVVEEVRVRHILTKDQASADTAIREIAGGTPFEEVAGRASLDDASKSKGGDLGFLTAEQLPPELGTAIAAMKAGETSAKPVATPFGLHVLKLEERRKREPPAFETVSAELRRGMEAQAVGKIIADLKASARIEKLVPDVAMPQASDDGHDHGAN
ncbi:MULTISPECIES: peptidyl-prolyl cis-trans isomerase [unclassified Shinella]|uniref:peptidyl-prolyl cis-trans isomerase n=1 Tax=unclassified Shinella TaxID=2643062 RepID=UPI00234EE70D|nr:MULTISPECIES: peptidyl-prolyl cis-trans isomerase [unclassified Shinella]MCO5152157.1 peptidyl-prolyl cis-trans isomerase [Shinella sp.]MDC7266709.1 peptidyl-prolyl cis-trans isomerase [Shinella sp. HY16]MDC7273606.1 peptidyl-prolyl cis-trans isomerase [Shinella sp. YZ44]